MPAMTRLLILSALLLSLTSCGFSLRSSTSALDSSLSVNIVADNPASELVEQLEASLVAAGVSITGNSAQYSLRLSDEDFNTRPVTVNGRARAAQYEVQLTVEFSLAQQDLVLISQETIVSTRTHFEDIANISGSNEELALLRHEMRQELVDRLMRRLAANSDNSAQ